MAQGKEFVRHVHISMFDTSLLKLAEWVRSECADADDGYSSSCIYMCRYGVSVATVTLVM